MTPDGHRVTTIDTHTGGEPTRVILTGGPYLGEGSFVERSQRFCGDHGFMRAVVCEPRGHEGLVGAACLPPDERDCFIGVVFFNSSGCLGMCGHGAIGTAVALHHTGTLSTGSHRFQTSAGTVSVTLRDANTVSVRNVRSYRLFASVTVDVAGFGKVVGDVAYGGNWFFLVDQNQHRQNLQLDNTVALGRFAAEVRSALLVTGIRGDDGHEIDHIELFGPSEAADSRSYVLCPDGAYDHSPCGTGLSAKLACLHAGGQLAPGETWRQESITGSLFEATLEEAGGVIVPTITGQAFVVAESTLVFSPGDPSAQAGELQ